MIHGAGGVIVAALGDQSKLRKTALECWKQAEDRQREINESMRGGARRRFEMKTQRRGRRKWPI